MNRFDKPALIVHADWSKSPTKRWQAQAQLTNGRYHLAAPTRIESLDTRFARLRAAAGRDGPIFIGFDFPIGLLGILQIVTGKHPLTEPTAPHLRHVEGRILEQVP